MSWEPMSENGEFIILFVANTFLMHDYEQCLSIVKQNLSRESNNRMLEGNLYRFFSLAAIKLFEDSINTDQEAFILNIDLLVQSIDTAQNALEIFNVQDQQADSKSICYEPNHYGVALCKFTIGYIYENFADYLCDPRFTSNPKNDDYTLGTREGCLTKAKDEYEQAYEAFIKVQHLFGKYLSKYRELQTSAEHEVKNEKL